MEATVQTIQSPLRLDKYFLKELHFALNEGFDRGREHENQTNIPILRVEVIAIDRNPDNPFQWRFELGLELLDPEDGDFPYKVAAAVVGYYTVSDEVGAERAERLAIINGPSLLYSAAREIVASVTGRSSFRPLLIPAVTFIQRETAEAKPRVKTLPPARRKAAKKAGKKAAAKKRTSKKQS